MSAPRRQAQSATPKRAELPLQFQILPPVRLLHLRGLCPRGLQRFLVTN
jgi:hypothetical protein